MARINLLPWREELRAEKTQQFAIMLGLSAVFAFGVVAIINFMFAGQVSHQKDRNKILTQEIATLDLALEQIKELEDTKAELLSRMDVIQSLQSRRPQVVHLFDDIVRTVPEGIYLTALKQNGNALTIKGVAESNGRVSAYMRNIDGSDWMATPKLSVIETKKGSLRSSDFELTTNQETPKGAEEEEQG